MISLRANQTNWLGKAYIFSQVLSVHKASREEVVDPALHGVYLSLRPGDLQELVIKLSLGLTLVRQGVRQLKMLHNIRNGEKEWARFLTHVSPLVFPPEFLALVPGIVCNRVIGETVDEEPVILSEVERFHVKQGPGGIKIFLEKISVKQYCQ